MPGKAGGSGSFFLREKKLVFIVVFIRRSFGVNEAVNRIFRERRGRLVHRHRDGRLCRVPAAGEAEYSSFGVGGMYPAHAQAAGHASADGAVPADRARVKPHENLAEVEDVKTPPRTFICGVSANIIP